MARPNPDRTQRARSAAGQKCFSKGTYSESNPVTWEEYSKLSRWPELWKDFCETLAECGVEPTDDIDLTRARVRAHLDHKHEELLLKWRIK